MAEPVERTVVAPPPVRLIEPIRRDLEKLGPGRADAFERTLRDAARPCVAITSTRVGTAPLRRDPILGLFGMRAAEPVLGPLESKFGGVPYCEEEEPWDRHRFLGQIDLARATALLPAGAPELRGLLRLDFGGELWKWRVRWFARHRGPHNTADFAWGSNVVYFLVPREDLARGRLDRVVGTSANA